MRLVLTVIGTLALLVSMAGSAFAVIGWCGNIYPNGNGCVAPGVDVDVYVQIWKPGVTDAAGQGADLGATLFYRCDGDPTFNSVPMSYLGDVGDNDEYTASIPAGHGCSIIEFYVESVDLTDMTYCYGQDQQGHDPNFFLGVGVTGQDVDVTFTMCLPDGIDSFFDVCVVGGGDPLDNWGYGITMFQPCPVTSPKLYQVTITFPAGSVPCVEYKYKKDDCASWEGTNNHVFVIDDTAPTQVLPVDGWEYNEPLCPDCTSASPVDPSQWGSVKSLFR